MGKCKKDITPLLTHWSYNFLALTHRYKNVELPLGVLFIYMGPVDLLTIYAKLRVVHGPGMPGTFPPPPWVSVPDMHHVTCVTHVP